MESIQNMKQWNFRFTDNKGGDDGWNSVRARGRASAIKLANQWCEFLDYTLLPHSVNSNEHFSRSKLVWMKTRRAQPKC
jgi:hypothetical protein